MGGVNKDGSAGHGAAWPPPHSICRRPWRERFPRPRSTPRGGPRGCSMGTRRHSAPLGPHHVTVAQGWRGYQPQSLGLYARAAYTSCSAAAVAWPRCWWQEVAKWDLPGPAGVSKKQLPWVGARALLSLAREIQAWTRQVF